MRSPAKYLFAIAALGFTVTAVVADHHYRRPVPSKTTPGCNNCPTPTYPTTPIYPSMPSTMPSTPSMMPSTPSTMPSTPSTMPSTPSTMPSTPSTTPTPNLDLTPAPSTGGGVGELFASQSSAGTSGFGSNAPAMIGDLGISGFQRRIVRLPSGATGSAIVGSTSFASTASIIPNIARSGFKVVENESPRPVDRIFVTYNYFGNLGLPGSQQFGLSRELIGFEKVLFGSNMSIGARLPFVQTGRGGEGQEGLGDLSIIGKYAFINNRETGNVFSAGMVVTVPTGKNTSNIPGFAGGDTTVLQPFLGYIYNADRIYLQGFTAFAIPTETEQTTLFFQSLGLGYKLIDNRQNSRIRYVYPTIEAHLTSPIENRGLDNPSDFAAPDIFIMTVGTHIGLLQRLNLTVAGATPLSGPKIFDFEFITQLNFQF